MKNQISCSFKIHEFAQLDGYYWEIKVPNELHPNSRIKEFVFNDDGLELPVSIYPTGLIRSSNSNLHTYRGTFPKNENAEALKSIFIYYTGKKIHLPSMKLIT